MNLNIDNAYNFIFFIDTLGLICGYLSGEYGEAIRTRQRHGCAAFLTSSYKEKAIVDFPSEILDTTFSSAHSCRHPRRSPTRVLLGNLEVNGLFIPWHMALLCHYFLTEKRLVLCSLPFFPLLPHPPLSFLSSRRPSFSSPSSPLFLPPLLFLPLSPPSPFPPKVNNVS